MARFNRITPLLLLSATLVLTDSPVQAEVYQYIDANGTISLTNVPNDPRYKRVTSELPRSRSVISDRELEPVIARHSRPSPASGPDSRGDQTESDFDPLAVSRMPVPSA